MVMLLMICWVITIKVTISNEWHSSEGGFHKGNARMPSCRRRAGMLRSFNCCWRSSSRRTPRPLTFVATWKLDFTIKISFRIVKYVAEEHITLSDNTNQICVYNSYLIAFPSDAPKYWWLMGYPEEESPSSSSQVQVDSLQNLSWDHLEMYFERPCPKMKSRN